MDIFKQVDTDDFHTACKLQIRSSSGGGGSDVVS